MTRNCRYLLFFLSLLNQKGYSQEYPFWFLYQGQLKSQTAVGYSQRNYYEESSKDRSLRNGCINMAKQMWCQVSGGQAFVDTEVGSFWMGSDLTEVFDTLTIGAYYNQLKAVDHFQNGALFVSLFSFEELQLNGKQKSLISIQKLNKPKWIRQVPDDKKYYYATGISPHFYYEISSWKKAEKIARENLARSICIEIRSLEKQFLQRMAIKNEEVDVVLRGTEVIARWRDLENNIFFVLIRMPK